MGKLWSIFGETSESERVDTKPAGTKPVLSIIGGTGTLGSGLAKKWARAGYPVIIGSRFADKAQEVAESFASPEGRHQPIGMVNAEAARAGEIIVLTVRYAHHDETIEQIKPYATGKLMIDATVPLDPSAQTRVQLPHTDSAAVNAQQLLGPETRVVSAFHNVPARKLHKDEPIDCDVLVFGDNQGDREIALSLVSAAGLRGIHGGPLANSAAAEALTSVLIGISKIYRIDGAGIRITGIDGTIK